ncbi:hypothetical protein EG68_11916 [Paragonimus skrjabini miyazakii]|uniref:Uncharacterized protein n=1 Tax=Paragonimus skrjabini miyazakii TaxID=59628 RepID=A0A8S9YJ25_9TREM|nr:hypothetical protein EG68_11916 [Paragonimus skrjabini miyazakii]
MIPRGCSQPTSSRRVNQALAPDCPMLLKSNVDSSNPTVDDCPVSVCDEPVIYLHVTVYEVMSSAILDTEIVPDTKFLIDIDDKSTLQSTMIICSGMSIA